jgi:hypothetical protein
MGNPYDTLMIKELIKAIHMVSAWATQNRLVLGQLAVDEKIK